MNLALPNLQGRVPIHFDDTFPLGISGGEETHTLTIDELPTHTHTVSASSDAVDSTSPVGNYWANDGTARYSSTANTAMSSQAVATVGGSQPHENRSPYLVLNFCIALVGIFPSQN